MTGVLPSSSPLARSPFGCTSRGSLSRSVFCRSSGFPVPQGTDLNGFCQDVESRVLISIQDKPTLGANMCPGRECFLYPSPTARTILAAVVWGNCYHGYLMHESIGLDPPKELSPCCIMDALGKCVVLHPIAYLEVFVGNPIVRCDERVRLFTGEILTLPIDLEIRLCQSLSGFLSVR